jgi:hypothetical protein
MMLSGKRLGFLRVTFLGWVPFGICSSRRQRGGVDEEVGKVIAWQKPLIVFAMNLHFSLEL